MTANIAGSQGSNDEDLKHPVFQGAAERDQRYGIPVVVRRGVYGNRQGQIFSIDVVGGEEDPVRVYTDQVRMRLMQQFIDDPKDSAIGHPDIDLDQIDKIDSSAADDLQQMLHLRSNLLRDNPRSLVITIDFVGISPMWDSTPPETRQQFIDAVPAEALGDRLQKDFDLATPSRLRDTLRQEHYSQDYVIDFIIDPNIGDRASHDYPVQCVKSARVVLDVSGGGGSVAATLTRNGVTVFTLEVVKGSHEKQDRTASSTKRRSYDLVVKDTTVLPGGSTYQVSGRWEKTYTDDPPHGGGTTCAAK